MKTPLRTLIIAEAGVNHNGDMVMARALIDAAAAAGADLVKFQTFSAGRLVTRSAPKATYQAQSTGNEEGQFEMLRRLELSPEMHHELIAHCEKRGIGFFSTAFDLDSIDLLVALGQTLFKVPSGEITNLPYLRRIARTGSDVIMSSGMATLADIDVAIAALEEAGLCREKITVLHCTTEYPTPMSEVNLRAMNSIASAFGVRSGYSDHTRGIEVAIAAVAIGAKVIEKHFTLDRHLPGPDHQASLEPQELKAMVEAIRNIESALGDGIKRPTPSEARNRGVVRKSIVAASQIRAGETLSADLLTVKRPGGGISPMRWDEIVGQTARRDYQPDEPIEP
jgi:N,N'-diacetyllegionaminate synthase